MHLDYVLGIYNPAGGHPIDWANVVARARSLFFTASYVLLLGAALFHGFYGLRNIVFELGPSSRVKTAVNWLCVIAGAGLFGLGSWAAWASLRLAKTL
jgi:succinate dehydrogenase / fumarate reductase membrane anchor subunit